MTSGEVRGIKIDLRHFGNFAAIAECRSISAAACQLGISQPALSESIARLERELGFPLLIRTSRGIEFTQAGAALAKYGRALAADVESELRSIARLGRDEAGRVSIAIPPTYASLIGVPLVETVRHERPDIQLGINEAVSPIIGEGVLAGDFDFGICYQGFNSKPFVVRPIMEEELVLLAAPDNWEGEVDDRGIALTPATFEEMCALPLVLPKQPNGLRQLIERHAKARNVQLNVAFEIDSLRSMITLVARASGFTVLSQAAAIQELVNHDLVLVPIVKPKISHTSYLVRKLGWPVSSASLIVERVLVNILSEQISRFRLRARLLSTQD